MKNNIIGNPLVWLVAFVAILALGSTFLSGGIAERGAPGPGGPGGRITDVNFIPADQWFTGNTVYIGYTWKGYPGFPVEVDLWSDMFRTTIATRYSKNPVGWIVPCNNIDPGVYSVRVQSTNNSNNYATRRIRIDYSKIQINAPKAGAKLTVGSLVPITWTSEGNPGPLKLELFSGSSKTALLQIAPNTPLGTGGQGQFDWLIPASLSANNTYWIRATSLCNSAIFSDTSYFSIGVGGFPKPPSVPVLQSLDATAVLPGGRLTVTGDFDSIDGWTAVIELENGEKFEQPIQNAAATQFQIVAPNIYEGYNITAKNAEHRQRILQIKSLYVKKEAKFSNKLAFNIISPYPIIDSIFKTPAHTGDILWVIGGNWDKRVIYAGYKAVYEYLPGQAATTVIIPPYPGTELPPFPIPLEPNQTLQGIFQTEVPQVFCGTSTAGQDAINTGTGKFYISGTTGVSNAVDIEIRKNPGNYPNPYSVILGPEYRWDAPNRTIYYSGSSLIILPDCQKATITNVKNTSSVGFKLYNRGMGGDILTNGIWLNPGTTTTAFNGQDATEFWQALGPESGTVTGTHINLEIDISWK